MYKYDQNKTKQIIQNKTNLNKYKIYKGENSKKINEEKKVPLISRDLSEDKSATIF